MDPRQSETTTLLARFAKGDAKAEAEPVPIVFKQLRKLAANYMRSERPDHTLQPTALVHEAYIRLIRIQDITWNDKAHFFGVASRLMRQVLVDHARAHNAAKRPHDKILLDDAFVYSETRSSEMLALTRRSAVLRKWTPGPARSSS